MALILAIASSADASVAVLRDGEELARWATDDTHAHAEVLAPAVQAVLGEAGVIGTALDAL
ncbi:tRNA (adenosine(37)-N6)-threonylcarbamoyltransferase complex dimerization subunit type 1 TsaB, partial [Xanthomonas citri pv. citri]|nr:tRNA (adenosine(37)-N6)-threonylcarbamoyltransferase complex dimerization subunit type 1 TsaB [Xanthomonas citri pv. citri]